MIRIMTCRMFPQVGEDPFRNAEAYSRTHTQTGIPQMYTTIRWSISGPWYIYYTVCDPPIIVQQPTSVSDWILNYCDYI
jgi:hypothetical protein